MEKDNINESWISRTELLIGEEACKILNSKHVLIVGIGGVGGYAAEQLCRAGIGELTLVDGDKVHNSNRNRQITALCSTNDLYKCDVMKDRLLDINPNVKINICKEYIRDKRMVEILEQGYDYVVDAIDTVSPKAFLIYHTYNLKMPIVSSMGAGGKFDPTLVKVSDLYDSSQCRLAYYMRKRLHKLGVGRGVNVVFSTEKVDKASIIFVENEQNKKTNVGTISYMPAVFGCACASVVIRYFLSSPACCNK